MRRQTSAISRRWPTSRPAQPVHVICLGLSALDQVWRVDRPFAGGSEKIKAVEYGTLGGGMAANASVAVAKLGASVAFWGGQGMIPPAMR